MNSTTSDTFNFIDKQFEDIDLGQFGLKERSYLAQYMTVTISGTFEFLIKNLIIAKFYKENSMEVVSLIESHLYSYFRNPKFQKISELLEKFNTQWASDFNRLPNLHKIAIDNIVYHKNDIAHNLGSDITLTDIKNYYNNSKAIILKIEQMLN